MAKKKAKKARVEIYEDALGEWRWRMCSANGATVATSNESFYTKGNAKRAAKKTIAISSELDDDDIVVEDASI